MVLLPDGRWRYGFDGGTFIGSGLGGQCQTSGYHAGRYLIEGTVMDDVGFPVAGAAIRLGNFVVFSDSTGKFWLRVKKDHAVPVAVLPNEFAAPGNWELVAAPPLATPGALVRITVTRR